MKILRLSGITDVSIDALKRFDDRNFCNMLDELCPVISTVIKAATGESLFKDRERIGHRIMCYGIMFKGRFGGSRASVLAHRNDQLFIAAGVKKKAFKWFNKLGITNSYTTAHNKHKTLAENFNEEFLLWKNAIEEGDLSFLYQVMLILGNTLLYEYLIVLMVSHCSFIQTRPNCKR